MTNLTACVIVHCGGEMWWRMESIVLFLVVLTVAQFVGCGGGPLERQKQGGHFFRRTGTPTIIYWKNQRRRYVNDEV